MMTRGEQKIYADFLTNLAVAWFSAGVIAPFISPITKIGEAVTPITAGAASWIALQLAIFIEKGGK